MTPTQLDDLYFISKWSNGYFVPGENGLLDVKAPQGQAALREIVDRLREDGVQLPLILRFPQIVEDRLERINGEFDAAIAEAGYRGDYQGVYPVKVNQRRVIVETIAQSGGRHGTGLEAGSKAELALILVEDIAPGALIQCNGFKDDDFVRLALWGRKLGKNVVITLEKHSELERVLRISREMGVRPAIGVRFKLHSKGAGQWEASGGDHAKFGLTAAELLDVATRLQEEGLGDSLVMLHTHVGSQLTDIRRIKAAVREATQTYVSLRKLGTGLTYLNVGGGLAVDYDGSKTTYYVSANYGLREYADTVVYTVMEACDEAGAPHPTIVTESGRALTAHHAVLVIPVIDSIRAGQAQAQLPELDREEAHALVRDMHELLDDITIKNYREVYNEAVSNKETMHSLFDLGYLTLLERAWIEDLYARILQRVATVISSLDYVPDEFYELPRVLAEKYICNFSLFQSLPDNWAIQAMFPIVPLQRLDEQPDREATLVDITCDSDGKIERFIDLRDVKSTLPVHGLRKGEPYYLGVFLTGAYQDVLGNAHNLFGRVNEAHIRLTDGGWELERFIEGQKARRVLHNMGYEEPQLRGWLDETIAEAIEQGHLASDEAQGLRDLYGAELTGYTYLEQVG